MPTRSEIESYASSVAAQHGLDPNLVLQVIQVESSYNQSAIGSSGEVGLMQLMPSTAAGLGVNPYDWKQNIEGGVSYLAGLINRFGSWDMGLAAYNAGPGNVSRGIIPTSTRSYVDKILSFFTTGSTASTAIDIPTFSTTVYGTTANLDLGWLLAIGAGAAIYLITRRRG